MLRLHGFGFYEVPEDVLMLPNVETLLFGSNMLTSLPDGSSAMPKLKQLSLYANPIHLAYLAALRARFPHVSIRV